MAAAPVATGPGGATRGVLLTVATAVVYLAGAKIGLSLAFAAAQVTTVWPPTGIAIAATVLYGPRWSWPGIALGAFLANWTQGEPFVAAAGIAAGNTLEAVVAGVLLRGAGFDAALARLRDALALVVLAAAASTTLSATIGVLTLCASGLHPWTSFETLWWTWWVGDALGALVAAPLLLVWASPPRLAPAGGAIEAGALGLAAGIAGAASFSVHPGTSLAAYPLHYAVFPFVIWAALRFGQRGTTSVIFVVSAFAIWSVVRGAGPFGMPTAHERLFALQLFMAVVAATGLLMAAAISERDASRAQGTRDLGNLRVSEERLRLALDAGRMGVWDWNVVTGEIRWSDNLEAIHGLAPGSFPGTFEGFLATVHPDDRERVSRTVDQAAQSGHGYDAEFRNVRADGSVGWISAKGLVVRDDAGRPVRMLGVGMDATERRRLAEELEARARELAIADRRKDEFLAMLAHELRNPLAPMSTALHLLRAEGRADASLLGILKRQTKQLVRLVDDLLDVSRITQGKIALRKEPTAVEDIVARALEMAAPSLEARRQELRLALPAAPMEIDVDAARLAQVVANLLDNASKYTPELGCVTLAAEREAGMLVIRVRDTGAGLAPEMLPQVFDLFVQGDRGIDRTHGGLGIGLTIVRRLVELHGGRVEARSAGPGQGSEFIVRLPGARSAPPPHALAPQPATPSTGRAASGVQVLIVEDNVDAAEALAIAVGLWGHEVRVAHDAESALALVEEWEPDVVVSDLGLPRMDGHELARAFRRRPRRRAALLIALSGYGRNEDRRVSLEAGFDHHLVKPPDLDMLGTLLDGVAGGIAGRHAKVES